MKVSGPVNELFCLVVIKFWSEGFETEVLEKRIFL